MPNELSVINLYDYLPFYGCSGCSTCVTDGACHNNDSFHELYNNVIKNADAIIYGCEIENHTIDFMVKRCIDRLFNFGGKRKVVAFMLSGMVSKENQVIEWINAYTGISGQCLAGVVSDESGRESEITESIKNMSKRLLRILESGVTVSPGFYERGGMALLANSIRKHKAAIPAEYKAAAERGMYVKPLSKKEALKRMKGIEILRKIVEFMK